MDKQKSEENSRTCRPWATMYEESEHTEVDKRSVDRLRDAEQPQINPVKNKAAAKKISGNPTHTRL